MFIFNNLFFNKIIKFKNPQLIKDWANTLQMTDLGVFMNKDLSVLQVGRLLLFVEF